MARQVRHLAKLRLPFLVAESPTGQILGYALVQPMVEQGRLPVLRSRTPSTSGTRPPGKGLGRALLGGAHHRCEDAGIREIVAVISDGADASVALHEKLASPRPAGWAAWVSSSGAGWASINTCRRPEDEEAEGLFRR